MRHQLTVCEQETVTQRVLLHLLLGCLRIDDVPVYQFDNEAFKIICFKSKKKGGGKGQISASVSILNVSFDRLCVVIFTVSYTEH